MLYEVPLFFHSGVMKLQTFKFYISNYLAKTKINLNVDIFKKKKKKYFLSEYLSISSDCQL